MGRKTQEKTNVYRFNEGLTEEKFREIVFACADKIKRIQNINVNGLTICCTVVSVTGLTSWNFVLDFNDCGELTGECYIKTGNHDSDIPQRLNNLICEKLKPYIERIEKVKESKRKEEEKEKKRKSQIKKRIITTLVAILTILIFTSFGYYEYQRLIPVGYSTSDLIGNEYSTVITGWITDDGEIESISIDGNKEYDSCDNVRLDAEVIITYHTYKKNKPQ